MCFFAEVTDLLDFGLEVCFDDVIHGRLERAQAGNLWRTIRSHTRATIVTSNHM